MPVAGLLEESEVQARAILADDVPRPRLARRRMRPILNQAAQLLDVIRRHRLREGHVQRDAPGDAELVNRQVGVGRNHAARTEVHSLAHQVAADAAALALQPFADALHRPPAAHGCARLASDCVVEVAADVELQQVCELPNHVSRRAVCNLLAQVGVRADNLSQFVRQVILAAARIVDTHTWPHIGRRHRQDSEHHPVRARVRGVQTQGSAVLIADSLEDGVHLLSREHRLALRRRRQVLILVAALPVPVLRRYLAAVQPERRLRLASLWTEVLRLGRIHEAPKP